MYADAWWSDRILLDNPYEHVHSALPTEVFYHLNRDRYITGHSYEEDVLLNTHIPSFPLTEIEQAIKEFVYDNDVDKLAEYIINNLSRTKRRRLIQRLAQAL